MFGPFRKVTSLASVQREAQKKYDQVLEDSATHKGRRRPRIQMAMLCRAFLDRTFIDGAEQSVLYIDKLEQAITMGLDMPKEPEPKTYQKVASSMGPVWTYAPDIYAKEAFSLGRAYQSMEIDAHQAIDSMQSLIDRLCHYELRLEDSISALQFLREEIAVNYELTGQAPTETSTVANSDAGMAQDHATVLLTVVPHIRNELATMGLTNDQISRLQKLGMLKTQMDLSLAA
jgi:hypothetical protein